MEPKPIKTRGGCKFYKAAGKTRREERAYYRRRLWYRTSYFNSLLQRRTPDTQKPKSRKLAAASHFSQLIYHMRQRYWYHDAASRWSSPQRMVKFLSSYSWGIGFGLARCTASGCHHLHARV
jgi:hypothetical protein